MKLRSKNTGHVFDFAIKANQDDTACYFTLKTGSGGWEDGLTYGTLEELHEEWEDYEPAEPLIKDEKIRKAVRAWAEANKIGTNHYLEYDIKFDFLNHRLTWISTSIEFNEAEALIDLDDGQRYTIAELCGEEE